MQEACRCNPAETRGLLLHVEDLRDGRPLVARASGNRPDPRDGHSAVVAADGRRATHAALPVLDGHADRQGTAQAPHGAEPQAGALPCCGGPTATPVGRTVAPGRRGLRAHVRPRGDQQPRIQPRNDPSTIAPSGAGASAAEAATSAAMSTRRTVPSSLAGLSTVGTECRASVRRSRSFRHVLRIAARAASARPSPGPDPPTRSVLCARSTSPNASLEHAAGRRFRSGPPPILQIQTGSHAPCSRSRRAKKHTRSCARRSARPGWRGRGARFYHA